MPDQITIAKRFRGPPNTANGGYVSGLLAGFVRGTAEVTLRMPPPLDQPMSVKHVGAQARLIDAQENLIAVARPAKLDVAPPTAPSYEEAEEAAVRGQKNRASLEYNTCFVCGLERAPGDGLRISFGPLDGGSTVAGTWTPDASVANPDGMIPPEIVWSALDCTSGFPYMRPDEYVVLGRYGVRQQRPVRRDGRYILHGWPTGDDGRKLFSASALYEEDGTLCAVAKATWIRLNRPAP